MGEEPRDIYREVLDAAFPEPETRSEELNRKIIEKLKGDSTIMELTEGRIYSIERGDESEVEFPVVILRSKE